MARGDCTVTSTAARFRPGRGPGRMEPNTRVALAFLSVSTQHDALETDPSSWGCDNDDAVTRQVPRPLTARRASGPAFGAATRRCPGLWGPCPRVVSALRNFRGVAACSGLNLSIVFFTRLFLCSEFLFFRVSVTVIIAQLDAPGAAAL